MHIKTTRRYHLTPVRWLSSEGPQITNVGEVVEIRQPLYSVSRNANWVQPQWKTIIEVPQS